MSSIRVARLLIAGLLALMVAPAFAAQPERFTTTIDRTVIAPFTSSVCGFPVERHLEGTITTLLHTNNGNGVLETTHIHLEGSFTNLENSKSVPFTWVQTEQVALNQDGSATVATAGGRLRITLPGQGIVFGQIGRVVVTYPADGGEPVVDFEAGHFERDVSSGICAALA